jgi:hypothetical protein
MNSRETDQKGGRWLKLAQGVVYVTMRMFAELLDLNDAKLCQLKIVRLPTEIWFNIILSRAFQHRQLTSVFGFRG